RTARLCDELREAGYEGRISELTGLRLDPYFTGTKLTWLALEEPATWAGLADGSLAAGTVDSYLIARLTGGGRPVTRPPHPPAPPRPPLPARWCSTSPPDSGLTSCANCCGCPPRPCPRWFPPPASPGAPTRPPSSAWICLSPASPVTSRRRCSARRALQPETPNVPTGPARSCSRTPAAPWPAPGTGCCPPWPGWTTPARAPPRGE